LVKAALVEENPCSDRKAETAEIKFAGSIVSFVAFACFVRELSVVRRKY
jgi:hypothetical protein